MARTAIRLTGMGFRTFEASPWHPILDQLQIRRSALVADAAGFHSVQYEYVPYTSHKFHITDDDDRPPCLAGAPDLPIGLLAPTIELLRRSRIRDLHIDPHLFGLISGPSNEDDPRWATEKLPWQFWSYVEFTNGFVVRLPPGTLSTAEIIATLIRWYPNVTIAVLRQSMRDCEQLVTRINQINQAPSDKATLLPISGARDQIPRVVVGPFASGHTNFEYEKRSIIILPHLADALLQGMYVPLTYCNPRAKLIGIRDASQTFNESDQNRIYAHFGFCEFKLDVPDVNGNCRTISDEALWCTEVPAETPMPQSVRDFVRKLPTLQELNRNER